VELVILAEFIRRRPDAIAGSAGVRVAAEEAAWKVNEGWARMADQATRAVTVAARLPHTLAALSQGLVSDYKVKIIEAQTTDLGAEDVAKADVILAASGQLKNPAGLRDFARRQVARLDPEAAGRKKERGRREGYVRAWQEDSGNMGLSAREMPNTDGLVAWQNIERRALDLHAAGAEGTAGQLQVRAMLDFLLGRATPGGSAHQDTHRDEDGDDGPARRRRAAPGQQVVPDHDRPRRHRRRARLHPRPPHPRRHPRRRPRQHHNRHRRTRSGAESEAGAGRHGCVRSRARRGPLPAQPQAPPPRHGPHHPVRCPWLQSPRGGQ
jgi:hypothetical protein